MNKLIWIISILALYGAISLYQDVKHNETIQNWISPVVKWFSPKEKSEELALATDIAFYVSCIEGVNPQIGESDQFIVKEGGKIANLNSSKFISKMISPTSEYKIWYDCNLDSVTYSVSHMDTCIARLIKNKCK